MKLQAVREKRDIRLKDRDARVHEDVPTGEALDHATTEYCNRIAALQHELYADGRFALLIVLQGRDASGKDGTIRKVFGAVNPQGCSVTAFAAPTELEARHDFLWRVHQAVPPRRMIGIFNRSHYEDVLVPRVRHGMKKKEWTRRYDAINGFERLLTDEHTVVLKFMLHISRDEQRVRLQERVDDREKNWKFQAGDLEDRERWDDYTAAYRSLLLHTSTDWAPWYIVPADDKSVRNWLIARRIADTLSGLRLRYPKANGDVKGLEVV